MSRQDLIIQAILFIPGSALAVATLFGESIYATSQCGSFFAVCTENLGYSLIFFLAGLVIASYLTYRYLGQLQVLNIKKITSISIIHLILLSVPLGIAGIRLSLLSLIGYPLIYFVYYFLFNKLSLDRKVIYSVLFFTATMAISMALAGR